MKKGLAIIIPTYSAAAELDLALESLEKNSRLDNELIVIVDARKDGGYDSGVIEVLEKHDQAYLKNQQNLGPYGSWNRGAKEASREWLCFATDDQYFAPGWDEALWEQRDEQVLLAGTVVEPGIIPVWKDNIEKDFGHNPVEFAEEDFCRFVEQTQQDKTTAGGFFVPLIAAKSVFEQLGGWPTAGEFGSRNAPANDITFIKKAQKKGYQHRRSQASFSYHFQGSTWRRKQPAEGVAAVIISRPQEPYFAACLESVVDWVDEVIVVVDQEPDNPTEGNVVSLARQHEVSVYFRPMDTYARQKNFAIDKADSDWILSLDADEAVSPALVEEIQGVLDDLSYNGYLIPRQNIIFGKQIRGAGWYPDYQLRLYVKGYGQFAGAIHERIRVNGSVGKLNNPLIHQNYQTISGFIARLNRYTDAEVKKLAQQNYQFNITDVVDKPYREFLKRFFAQKGWRDGWHGLALCLLMSFYSLAIYLKAWEKAGFKEKKLDFKKLTRQTKSLKKEGAWWWYNFKSKQTKGIKRIFYKILAKIWQKCG